mmetsp:Transcript_15397/g.39663  ORF Transcript_15397/g.39663 Transcript_15397/m.39663 type:complete len:84 (+) Transcript_15397:217-468(+)
MKQWHHSHPMPSTVALGEPITPSSRTSFPTLPALTWTAMWDVIRMDDSSATNAGSSGSSAVAGSASVGGASGSFLNPLSKRPD